MFNSSNYAWLVSNLFKETSLGLD
uniref:Uncharacterized protein n=1 Tax=Anguilla anguilla TaxID=7936 RepID=A0A0E9TYR4_ANGAN